MIENHKVGQNHHFTSLGLRKKTKKKKTILQHGIIQNLTKHQIQDELNFQGKNCYFSHKKLGTLFYKYQSLILTS